MTISKRITHYALLMGIGIISSGQAFAGFHMSETLPPAQVDYVQVPDNTSPISAPDDVMPPVEAVPLTQSREPSKPLVVFSDRYVPDSVKEKYKLNDAWYQGNENIPVPLEAKPYVLQVTGAPTKKVETWRARKDESMREVLARWSKRAGTDLMWASAETPTLQKAFSFVGNFQDAVNALIAQEGGNQIHSQYRSEGMDPVMMTPAATITTNDPTTASATTPSNTLSQIFKPQESKGKETRWFGLSGAPLAEVIRVWAEDAGVKLMWQSEKNFALKESVSEIGTFEEAVYKALSQYDNDGLRPVGEMYIDPQSGQRVLLVRSDVN